MQAVVEFILEIDRLKAVTRKVKPMGQDRYENSAEHSWQLALLALSLAPHADAGTDMDRVVRMLLVHDIGEIDTGDTLAFVEHGWAERKAAELAAVTRIFGLLPEGERELMLELWREFEAAESREARFANAIDRVMPVLLNLANRGQSWRENDVSYERVVKRIEPPIRGGCPALWDWLAPRLEQARVDGWFGGAG